VSDQSGKNSAAAEKAPLWKRLLPIAGGLAIVVFVFGWVLPQFIDYESAFRAIGEIDAFEWIVLIIVAVIRFIPEGWLFVAAQPGLNTKQGMSLFLVANTLSNVPPGGLDLISRYQMTRSWGFPASSATAGTVASWVFATFGKLVMPILAALILATRRIADDQLDFLAIIGLAIVVGGAILLAMVLRSPEGAARVGEPLGRFVRWVAGLFRKEVKTDFARLSQEFREQSADVLRKRWHVGLTAGLAAQLASFMVLFLAIRFVGIGSDQMHWSVAFGAFSIVAAVTTIPIFNAPGIAEATYISIFNSAVGTGATDAVAAAVFVFRILTWVAPIPLGGFAFTRWRDEVRQRGDVDLLDAFDKSDETPA
jgi:hypothetical protein